MGVAADRRFDVDMGSAKEKARVAQALAKTGRTASAVGRAYFSALADAVDAGQGESDASASLGLRDRRGFRAAAHMLVAARRVRQLIEDAGANLPDANRRLLQLAIDDIAKAVAEL